MKNKNRIASKVNLMLIKISKLVLQKRKIFLLLYGTEKKFDQLFVIVSSPSRTRIGGFYMLKTDQKIFLFHDTNILNLLIFMADKYIRITYLTSVHRVMVIYI